jgi:fucose permease
MGKYSSLCCYCINGVLNLTMWLCFGSVVTTAQDKWSISAAQVNLLASSVAMTYIVFALHGSYFLTRHGLYKSSMLACVLTLVGALLRWFVARPVCATPPLPKQTAARLH